MIPIAPLKRERHQGIAVSLAPMRRINADER